MRDSHVPIEKGKITGFIGPSGCGKSTVLRSLNRMNDLIPASASRATSTSSARTSTPSRSTRSSVRRHIGMVFQQPNPFSMSIFENVAFGLRLNRYKGDMDERVEHALRRAALWDEVKDKLKNNGLSLSGGQQQRLCIARAVATEPTVLLMDEPCSALDPIATRRIEELMLELKKDYTIAIVTHNMQQAQRVADTTAFFSVDISEGGRTGYLVEIGPDRADLRRPARAAHQGLCQRPVQLSAGARAHDQHAASRRPGAAMPLSAGLRCGGLPRRPRAEPAAS